MVIDASLTLAWYLDGETTVATDSVLDRVTEVGAVVPGLWTLEVANALQMAVRRQRLSEEYRDSALAELAQLSIRTDPHTVSHAWTTTLRLAQRFGLTIYDACYLELAQRLGVPLATLDKGLRSAATAVGVPLLGL